MKVFRLAAVFALLAGPAYAQLPNINLMPETKTLTPEEKEQEAAQQRAYRDSLKKIPDAKAANDPWGTVRSTDTPKTSVRSTDTPKTSAAKTIAPAKPKTKTGSAQTKVDAR
jgi:hypothetical protein